eukprot:gnl/TRDRNA2_/TRDRNA2_157507_c0_seq2.p2 gnl/TRDRNA2_/TRDRNA2_157507_c0~~gnl/TRDRNA2_/TRDRNA2_157507_c0_seq2.p2  ORF type:complete len:101 (+),score=12.44 gnl/TRDRNA2_/TRDRNA2_157507_c0_seq2:177-479(+)
MSHCMTICTWLSEAPMRIPKNMRQQDRMDKGTNFSPPENSPRTTICTWLPEAPMKMPTNMCKQDRTDKGMHLSPPKISLSMYDYLHSAVRDPPRNAEENV